MDVGNPSLIEKEVSACGKTFFYVSSHFFL